MIFPFCEKRNFSSSLFELKCISGWIVFSFLLLDARPQLNKKKKRLFRKHPDFYLTSKHSLDWPLFAQQRLFVTKLGYPLLIQAANCKQTVKLMRKLIEKDSVKIKYQLKDQETISFLALIKNKNSQETPGSWVAFIILAWFQQIFANPRVFLIYFYDYRIDIKTKKFFELDISCRKFPGKTSRYHISELFSNN